MEKILYDFLKNTYNYKKLKEIRLKKKLTLIEVSEKTKIPVATIRWRNSKNSKRSIFETM